MLQLQEAIKRIIERYIVNLIPISEAISANETTIPLRTSGRFQKCDTVVIYNQAVLDATGEGEIRTISCIPDRNTIELDQPLIDAYTADTSFVQKLVGGRFVQGIYLGDPAKISHYPAITINAVEKSNEWFTLSSTKETYQIDISIFAEAGDYEESYRLMHTYSKHIEQALFRSLYPLAKPYDQATLAQPVSASDTVFQVTNAQDLVNHFTGYVFFENWDNLRSNRIKRILGSGVFETGMPIGADFDAGDTVIQPGRHFYNAFPRGIKFGTINQESTVFKAAVVSYMAQEEVKRYPPFIDPLTF